MKYKPFVLAILYIFFLFSGSAYGIGERTIILGSSASWNLVEDKLGLVEALQIRPHSVLALSNHRQSFARSISSGALLSADLSLSFDEGHPSRFADSSGLYDVAVSPTVAVAAAPWSRGGAGAALFTGQTVNEPIVARPRSNALFASGNFIRDFSIEFWLFPQNMGNGEKVLLWNSIKSDGQDGFFYQNIQCFTSRNRLQWTFTDFFFAPGQTTTKSLSFSGPTLPQRTWSHHLIRFDADLGLLEYLVDGNIEVIEYTTASGREGGDVYTPVIGENSRFVLGSGFSGMMDEFRIYDFRLENPLITKYPERGGRMETRALDLGHSNSRLLKVEAFGGRTDSLQSSNSRTVGPHTVYLQSANSRARNEYVGNSSLSFPNHAEIQFFIRTSNNPHYWDDAHWAPFTPGSDLAIQSRYIQLAADFYPSWDGETSPYLSELRIIYRAAEPALPPARVIATAKDGAVEVSWRASPSRDIMGYLVYYGTASGEYFGQLSPVDVGNTTSLRIDNLNNGTLYYFTVAAYNSLDVWTRLPEPGDFSRETAARPLRMVE